MNQCRATIVSSLKHKNTQPIYIFNRVRIFHLDRLKEGTWLYNFEFTSQEYEFFIDNFADLKCIKKAWFIFLEILKVVNGFFLETKVLLGVFRAWNNVSSQPWIALPGKFCVSESLLIQKLLASSSYSFTNFESTNLQFFPWNWFVCVCTVKVRHSNY